MSGNPGVFTGHKRTFLEFVFQVEVGYRILNFTILYKANTRPLTGKGALIFYVPRQNIHFVYLRSAHLNTKPVFAYDAITATAQYRFCLKDQYNIRFFVF